MKEQYLNIQEVALLIGCSVPTINNWYRFKKWNPDNPICELLPEFEQRGSRQTRYWKRQDIPRFLEFRQNIVRGRNGVMGSVTQKYYKKDKKNEAS